MGFDRRGFIQLVTGGVVGTLFTPIPWKLADDISIWTQNWPWISKLSYGESLMKPAVSKLCSSGCAVNVRMNGALPTTANGNPDNALSSGGVCPLCAAAVQLKYSPSRVNGPMKKDGSGFKSISWDEAMGLLKSKLSAAKGDGKVALISGDETGTMNELLSAFMGKLGQSGYYMMPGEEQNAYQAWNKLMGGKGRLGYDIENSDFVLLVGADALDSWGPSVRNQKAFGNGAGTFVYAGPVQNRTAAVSKKWIPVSPDGMAAFCLGVANALGKLGASDAGGFGSLAAEFTPAKVERITGVKASDIEAVAKALAAAKKPLVIAGSEFGQGAGAAPIAAAVGVNMMLGRVNKPGGLMILPDMPQVVEGAMSREDILDKDLVGYLASIEKGKAPAPAVLMVYEANPVYALPQAPAMAKVIEKAGFKVSFSTYMDETAAQSDLILPTPHTFERYDDVQSPYGLGFNYYSLGTPVSDPEYNTKNTGDVVIELAKSMGFEMGFDGYSDLLEAKAGKVGEMTGFTSDAAKPWEVVSGAASAPDPVDDLFSALEGGTAFCSVAVESPSGSAPRALAQAAKPTQDNSYPLAVAPVAQLNVGSTNIATPPQNLTTIPDYELKGKDMFVDICGETAGKYGVVQGSKVKLTGPGGEISARVNINEGVMPDVVAAPLGFGHTAWDAYTKGKGANVYTILSVSAEPGTGMAVWTGSKVKIAKI